MVHYLAGQLSSQLNLVAGATVVKPAAGKVVTLIVGTAATVSLNDCASAGAVAAANAITPTALAAGVYKLDFPFLFGLVATVAGGIAAVSYE
jgi:hypothetical protein